MSILSIVECAACDAADNFQELAAKVQAWGTLHPDPAVMKPSVGELVSNDASNINHGLPTNGIDIAGATLGIG